MILLLVLLLQASDYDNTASELAFCNSRQNDQPYRFCLTDRKHERAARELATALADARRSAIAKKREIARFAKTVGGVTLTGDPVIALNASQKAWQRSYRADCLAAGLSVATGNGGTEGVTANLDCEADRTLDRVRFLSKTYSIGR